jgi:hypothetical protein
MQPKIKGRGIELLKLCPQFCFGKGEESNLVFAEREESNQGDAEGEKLHLGFAGGRGIKPGRC